MATFTLLQYGNNPYTFRIKDMEGRTAFTAEVVSASGNLTVRLLREDAWTRLYPVHIKGPSTAFFYFGPSMSPGRLGYGSLPTTPMLSHLRKSGHTSQSRHFTTQNGRNCKWKMHTTSKMECSDAGGSIVATWETDGGGSPTSSNSRIVVTEDALDIITEVIAILALNRMAHANGWR